MKSTTSADILREKQGIRKASAASPGDEVLRAGSSSVEEQTEKEKMLLRKAPTSHIMSSNEKQQQPTMR